MASSASVFSDTLNEITNTKLRELSQSHTSFESLKASLLTSVAGEDNAISRLNVLSHGMKQCFGIGLGKASRVLLGRAAMHSLGIELQNLDRFLDQAKRDPSVSSRMLSDWEQSLLHHLDVQSLKYQYASLYGQLVTEWISSNEAAERGPASEDVDMADAPKGASGDEKLLEARVKWEQLAFSSPNLDKAALKEYLDDIFGRGDDKKKKATRDALLKLREKVCEFERELSHGNLFNHASLRWAIRGLCSSDLLSNEKREVLKDFQENTIILAEIADVLNMRLSALSSWTWSSGTPVPLEARRKINGRYDVHMHQDLLQAIFLQVIGVKWSVFFKRELKRLFSAAGAWRRQSKDVPKADRLRLGYYLGPLHDSPSLQSVRSKIHRKSYFMTQLLRYEGDIIDRAEGKEEADYEPVALDSMRKRKAVVPAPRKQLASKVAHRSAPSTRRGLSEDSEEEEDDEEEEGIDDDGDKDDNDGKDHDSTSLKQRLLHILSADTTINTQLYGETTVFHSVFHDWDASLPHETIYTILEYFGVSKAWLDFFTRFLEAPLLFADDDKSTTPSRTRKRGTPSAYVLSEVFGEAALFCLDLTVNQATGGGEFLWRVGDDCWFWSRNHDVALKAWKAVEKFQAVTGTKSNPARTGTVRVSRDGDDAAEPLAIAAGLPAGEIRWGLLVLSPTTGRFEIDQSLVNVQIEELRAQLKNNQGSILGFVHAWNAFAGTFISSNFGEPANCFGRRHVDDMLDTHARVQREVFAAWADDNARGPEISSVADYIKQTIQQRFGIDNVPDGYLHLPTELGGLDLRSPFIPLLQMRDLVLESPNSLLEEFAAAERDAYDHAREAFDSGSIRHERYALDDPDWKPESAHDRDNFMSFEEFTRHRECFDFEQKPSGMRLRKVYRQLMRRSLEEQETISLDTGKIKFALEQLNGQTNLRTITWNWYSMDPYWRWVVMMYGPEVVDRFGGLNIVDPGLLPMGMVSLFKEKRINWLA